MGTGSLRNQPCPCRSGRKFKDCCWNRKRTSEVFDFHFAEKTPLTKLTTSQDGGLSFFSGEDQVQPVGGWHTLARERDKSPKILTKMPIFPASASPVTDLTLYKQLTSYDAVFAIDTNTQILFERQVSVACVAQCQVSSSGVLPHALRLFEFHNATVKPENLAWYVLQRAAISGPSFCSGAKYAIITDSDLGLHAAYNHRSIPFCGRVTLSPEFTLLYAADEGRTAMNHAMKFCDASARNFIRRLTAEEVHAVPAAGHSGLPFSHARFVWNSIPDPEGSWFQLGVPRFLEIDWPKA